MAAKQKDKVKLTLCYERLDDRGRRIPLGRRDGATLEALGGVIAQVGEALAQGMQPGDIQQAINEAVQRAESAPSGKILRAVPRCSGKRVKTPAKAR